MLPTAEGGKANAWLRQKNAGIYVRPRLFSPYVEEAKVRFIYLWLMGVIDGAETGGIYSYRQSEQSFCKGCGLM